MAVKPVPDEYHSLTPYLVVDNAREAIDFYKRAFGATERGVMDGPDGLVMHAEIQIGDSVLMLSDPFPQSSSRSPGELGGTSGEVFLYVEDVDATVKQAVSAGAEVITEVQDMFWGDRYGKVTDPFGQRGGIATHTEDLSEEEMAERGREAMAQMG